MCQHIFYAINLRRQVRGTNLLELLISLSLSLLLLGVLSNIYLAVEHQHEVQASLNALQNNSRFVIQSLMAELRKAGYLGCPRLNEDFPLANTTPYAFNPANKLELSQGPKGSTLLTVRYRARETNILQASMEDASVLDLDSENKISPGTVLLISDCQQADIFQVAQVLKQSGRQRVISLHPLHHRYSEKAEVGRFEINSYFVENTGREDEKGQPISALYLSDLSGQKTELVEGVQKLSLEYLRPVRTANNSAILIELEMRQKDFTRTEYVFIALEQTK